MKNDILAPVIEYAGNLIVSNDLKDVYIGLTSLGAILVGPDIRTIEDTF